MNAPFRSLRSPIAVLPTENIDTDQIYPGRFLTVTTRVGLGEKLFADWRYDREGRPRPDFALNRPESAGAQILVAGRNFGCGSSREHAVWALAGAGFRAVISTSIADIFRRNALKNGVLPVVIEKDAQAALVAAPGATVEIDLAACRVTLPGGVQVPFSIEPFARFCLMEGLDELQVLLKRESEIAAYERAARPPLLVSEA